MNVDGAHVFVDGRLVGTSPFADEIYIEPTGCTVEAKLEGYTDARQTVPPVKKGSSQDVVTVLVPERRGPSTAIVVMGSVLTAASLAVGIGFTVAANGKSDDANADLPALQKTGMLCPNAAIATPCTELRSKLASLTSLHNAAEGAFIGAGVLGLATAAYAFLPIGRGSGGKASGSVRIVPVVGAVQSGFLISGSF